MHELIRNKGQDGTYCEKVVGSTPRVHTLAGFQDKNAPLMHLIALNGMMEIMEGVLEDINGNPIVVGNISDRDYEMYKMGIGYVGGFMSKCVRERELARAAKKKELEE